MQLYYTSIHLGFKVPPGGQRHEHRNTRAHAEQTTRTCQQIVRHLLTAWQVAHM